MKTHIFILKHLLLSLRGDTQSFGFIYDLLKTQGKSYIATFLGYIANPEAFFLFTGEESTKLVQETIRKTMELIFESCNYKNPKTVSFFDRNEHLYMFSMMREYNAYYDSLLGLGNFKDIISDSNLFHTLKGVSRQEDVDLAPIFPRYTKAETVNLKLFGTREESEKINAIEEEFKYFTDKDKGIKLLKLTNSLLSRIHARQAGVAKNLGYEANNDGINLSIPGLFRVLFRVMKGDYASYLDLLSIMMPLFKQIPGGRELMVILYTVGEGKIKDFELENQKDLLAMLIYSSYSVKKAKHHELLPVLGAKYKHSIDNLTKISQFSESLVSLINRKHSSTTITQSKEIAKKL